MTRDEMERRRRLAGELLERMSQADVAKHLQVSRMSITRWTRMLRSGGIDALRSTRATGRPNRMTPQQTEKVIALWRSREKWTFSQFQEAIQEKFGVTYDPAHVGRIVRRLGLRPVRARREKVQAQGGGE